MTDGELVHAGRTVTAMSPDADQRMVEEFIAGAEVPDIAARYAVPEAYVDRIIEQTTLSKPKRFDWSLNPVGNRIMYSVAAALAINLMTGWSAIGWVIGVVLFVLISAIVSTGRQR